MRFSYGKPCFLTLLEYQAETALSINNSPWRKSAGRSGQNKWSDKSFTDYTEIKSPKKEREDKTCWHVLARRVFGLPTFILSYSPVQSSPVQYISSGPKQERGRTEVLRQHLSLNFTSSRSVKLIFHSKIVQGVLELL